MPKKKDSFCRRKENDTREKTASPYQIKQDDLLFLLNQSCHAILEKLNNSKFGFIFYLQNRKYVETEDKAHILEIVIELISRVCLLRSENVIANVDKFIRMLKDCEDFLFDDVPRLIHSCVSKKHSINLVIFLVNYMDILKTLLKREFFPCERILNEIFPALENYMNRLREQKIANLDKAETSFQRLKTEVGRHSESENSSDEDDIVEDFRALSIVPRERDIINCEVQNIPKNIVDSSYRSVNHYLSVHFKLMREDMLRSFRECIRMCINPGSQKFSNCGIYEKVFVQYPPQYTVRGVIYSIKITTSKEVDWSKKDALIPGSLVFLTPDSFNSVVFASVTSNPRVSNAKSKYIDLHIKLEDDLLLDELHKDIPYKMIEPNAYFECYKHVLSAMKDFSEVTFPLSDIIAYFDYSNTEPKYLSQLTEYCVHENCKEDESTESCSCKVFSPMKTEEWPTSKELGLDEMQYNAYKVALTKKVAVIQGPPGTGKTFIGVKVVKSLLTNVSAITHKPIVICCLTNHALDQFLERILHFTKKVIRVGSQSKSEILEPHKLENLIYANRQNSMDETLDEAGTKSLNLVRKIAPRLIGAKTVVDRDDDFYNLEAVSNLLNQYLHIYSLCEDKFLEDSALNKIVDRDYQNQLRRVTGAFCKSLSDGVLEWLVCSRSDDLYEKCRKKFHQFECQKNLDIPFNAQDLWALTETKRYALFYGWRRKCLNEYKKYLEDEIQNYKAYLRRYKEESRHPEKVELIKCADVIGVTTTGACKFRNYIRLAKPCIMVVEEAAQVLESHIIASLVPSIQHLILIGDHEQLRPLPADHDLSETYNLKVSMFERLFKNGAPSATLIMQHRMKPCIAELLVPLPYEQYESYDNVKKYEEINGVESSVFFFEHRHLEDENSFGCSSSNTFEAQMVVNLAKYFSYIDYTADKITILATYSGQVKLILDYIKVQKLTGIHVTTVDNFQGEENDIIILSFVRSNEGFIGFLKESNRMCVALSRARKGMFCFGNFRLFASKNKLWGEIVQKLDDKKMIGNILKLKCFKHQTLHPVDTPEGILEFINSGCSEICNFDLPCSHKCTRKCHFLDAEHRYYLCKEPCKKMIDETRICPRMCYEKCKKLKKASVELPCGHFASSSDATCNKEITLRLPCTHEVTIPCHVDVQKYKCNARLKVKLDCGHVNDIRCYEIKLKTNVVCTGHRQEIGLCGHTIAIPCSMYLSETDVVSFCDKACGVILDCGHPCVGLCRVCFDTGIHAFCSDKCEMVLTCGHTCEGYCGSPCPPCTEKCFLTCGHRTPCPNNCLRSCVRCEKSCERVCKHIKCNKRCWEDCIVEACLEACDETLSCGHPCIGHCGDPCPYLCRECNSDSLKYGKERNYFYVQLECAHVIEESEMSNHVAECLSSYDWPCCPECSKPITNSTRYKKELREAKKMAICCNDTKEEISKVWYLVDCMYGIEHIVPAQFRDINTEIIRILKHTNPESHTLFVIKSCVVVLKKLLVISSKFDESEWDDYIHGKFYTLLKWIHKHLNNASFQQLKELEAAVEQLNCDIKSTTRIKVNNVE